MSAVPEMPPYAAMLGLRHDGEVMVMPFELLLIGSPGRLHGGAVAGLMEIAANLAVRDALQGADAQLKPVNVTVDFLREGEPEEPGMSEEAAAFAVLGADIDAIGQAVARHWGFDEAMLKDVLPADDSPEE
jgi:hypothetical protein